MNDKGVDFCILNMCDAKLCKCEVIKQSEESLRKSHERLKNVFESTHVGIWEWNVLSGETHFNKRCAGIIGYTLDEISLANNKTWLSYAHPEDLKDLRAQFNPGFQSGNRSMEWLILVVYFHIGLA